MAIVFAIYSILSKRGYKKTGIVISVFILGFLFYSIYTAVYPTDSFYYQDYKSAVLSDPPPSASIIKKSASYPDFHGHYCSVSLIKMSKADYQTILNKLNKDTVLKKEDPIYSEELKEVLGNLNVGNFKASFTREETEKDHRHSYIGFLNDGQTLIIDVNNN